MIDQSFTDIIASFAAKTPTPGGGAAAALSACLGTSLLLMVVRFSRGKKATQQYDEQLGEAETQLEGYLQMLMPMAERDCRSFDLVSSAYALPKSTDEEKSVRSKAIEEGMIGAMVVPEETLCMSRDVLRAMSQIRTMIGKNIASDLGSGAELLAAGAEGAFLNVRINAAYLKDREKATAALRQNELVVADVHDLLRDIKSTVEELMG